MSDQEEARIAASRHFDDLYSRWLVHPSPGNRFLNDRYGSIPASTRANHAGDLIQLALERGLYKIKTSV
jgi:hypothetical protein